MNQTTVAIIVIIIAIITGWLLMRGGAGNQGNPAEESHDIAEDIKNADMNKQDVVFKTSMGDVFIDLFEGKTPKTVENFLSLAEDGFYDGTRFHRVIADFMVQGGDPLSKAVESKDEWGTGGPGYTFEDEIVEGLSNVKGSLSMANAGPNTNGSQFFINVADNTFLDGKHTVFGEVVDGMDVVLAISQVETEGKGRIDRPVEDVILEKVVVVESEESTN